MVRIFGALAVEKADAIVAQVCGTGNIIHVIQSAYVLRICAALCYRCSAGQPRQLRSVSLTNFGTSLIISVHSLNNSVHRDLFCPPPVSIAVAPYV